MYFPSLISKNLNLIILHIYLISFSKGHQSVVTVPYHMAPARALAPTLGLLSPPGHGQGPAFPIKGSDTYTSCLPGKNPSHFVWALTACARLPHCGDTVSACLNSDAILRATAFSLLPAWAPPHPAQTDSLVWAAVVPSPSAQTYPAQPYKLLLD